MTAVASPRTATTTKERASREPTYEIRRRKRFWEVVDSAGDLVCMTVYKRGAREVVRRLRSE